MEFWYDVIWVDCSFVKFALLLLLLLLFLFRLLSKEPVVVVVGNMGIDDKIVEVGIACLGWIGNGVVHGSNIVAVVAEVVHGLDMERIPDYLNSVPYFLPLFLRP